MRKYENSIEMKMRKSHQLGSAQLLTCHMLLDVSAGHELHMLIRVLYKIVQKI